MQQPRGVFVFEDQSTRKMAMLLVRIDDPDTVVPNANVLELDDNDEEMQLLPQGIGAAFMLGATPTGTGVGAAANTANTTYRPYGLIAFDGLGRIVTLQNYTTEGTDPARYPKGMTNLMDKFRQYIYPSTAGSNQRVGQPVAATPAIPREVSHASLLLFDKDAFNEQFPPDPAADWRKFPTNPSNPSTTPTSWLDQNGTAVVVNRYNGTLIKGQGE
jgi:hypothetical protein